MGKLIDMYVDLHTAQPQEFMDAVYEEVFDGFPEESEIDLLVAIDVNYDENEQVLGFTVRNYQTVRVDKDFLGMEFEDSIASLKYYDEWGRSQGADGYILVHKHQEGNAYPSPKDVMVNQILGTIDYARTELQPNGDLERTYTMMVIANRDESYPLEPPPSPLPIDDREIDLATIDKLVARVQADGHLPNNDEFLELFARVRPLIVAGFDAKDRGDTETVDRIKAETVPLLDQMQKLAFARAGLDPADNRRTAEELLRRLPPDLASQIDVDQLVDMMGKLDVGESSSISLPGGEMVIGRHSKKERPLEGNWDAPVIDEPPPSARPEPTKPPFADLDLSTLGDPMAATRAALAAARGAPVVATAADSVSDPGTVEAAESEGLPPVPGRPEVPDIFRNMGGPIDFSNPPL
jgi:hypothetical protein